MIVEAIVSAVTLLVEFIAGLFVGAGQTLTALDLFLVFFVLLAELVTWLALFIYQLLKAIIKFQKPVLVSKPVFWRPKPKTKISKK